MEFVEGAVASSSCGKDKGIFHVIMKIENDFAWITDGKHHTIEKMKKKKKKHLYITNTILNIYELKSNKIIKKKLENFNCNKKN